jgi:hypothetical protein
MKNKKSQLGPITTVAIIILLLFSIAMVNRAFTGRSIFNSKPSWNITITECENKTIDEQISFPNDFIPTDCQKGWLEIPCYDNQNNIIIGLTCERKGIFCYKTKDNNISGILIREISPSFELFSWYDKWLIEQDTNPQLKSMPIKKITTKEICKDTEVDNIKRYGGFIWHPDTFNYCSRHQQANETEIECVRRCHSTSIELNYILEPKSEITREWLNESCKCLDICANLECSNMGECSKYKCFDKYTVEVKQ